MERQKKKKKRRGTGKEKSSMIKRRIRKKKETPIMTGTESRISILKQRPILYEMELLTETVRECSTQSLRNLSKATSCW